MPMFVVQPRHHHSLEQLSWRTAQETVESSVESSVAASAVEFCELLLVRAATRSSSFCIVAITSVGYAEEVSPILASQPNITEYGLQFIPLLSLVS